MKDGDIISQHIGAARWDTEEIIGMLTGTPPLPSVAIRAKWERRLPAVEPPWTHSGRDCSVTTARTPSSRTCPRNVAEAIRLVVANHLSFRRISTELVRFTSDGSCALSKRCNVIYSSGDLIS